MSFWFVKKSIEGKFVIIIYGCNTIDKNIAKNMVAWLLLGLCPLEPWQAAIPLHSKSHEPYNLALRHVDVPWHFAWHTFPWVQLAIKPRQEEVSLHLIVVVKILACFTICFCSNQTGWIMACCVTVDPIHSSTYMSRHEDVPLHSIKFQIPFSLVFLHADVPSQWKKHDFSSAQFAFKSRQEEVCQHLIESVMDCIFRPSTVL